MDAEGTQPEETMKRIRILLLLSLLALSTATKLGGVAYAEMSRSQALMAMQSGDAGRRAQGIEQLAHSGRMEDVEALLGALRDQDRNVRRLAEGAIWSVWLRSGDPEADALVREGVARMEAQQMGAALDAFTRAIERRPDFAEAWNKRATAYFLIGDYDQALKDCDAALERNPNHFGALAGCGSIYAQRDELGRALDFLERAYDLNPNLDGVAAALELVRHRLGRSGRREI